jgi:hypothetical protein
LASRVRNRLAAVVNALAQLMRGLPVRQLERHGHGVVIIAPEYYWGDLSAEQRATQISLKRDYEPIAELLRLLLSRAPEDLLRQIDDADKRFRVWLELQNNWSLAPMPGANERALRSDAAALERILAVLDVTGTRDIVVISDTNSLLARADPIEYRSVVGNDSFTFMLLPTVLGELDRLKIEHRNPDVREKAKNTITRIKGWRQQGSLSSGVTVNKSITVKACHSEPDMRSTLSWLDANIADDRIVASVLAVQTEQPSARIVLVTGDINLQNKADAALIETAEVPYRGDGVAANRRRGSLPRR